MNDNRFEAIDEIAAEIGENARTKGFHSGDLAVLDFKQQPRVVGILAKLALIGEENGEACTEAREGNWALRYGEGGKPEGFVVELADIIIRTLDLARALNLPIGEAIRQKMAYNLKRPYLHGKSA